MPISTNPRDSVDESRGIENILTMVRGWEENVRKGKDGEGIVQQYLVRQGYQVNVIASHNIEKSEITFGENHREGTIFSPDFLACKDGDISFVDSKAKTHRGFLGIINVSDYNKYFNTMKSAKGIGFKIYFPLRREKEMWIMEKLVSPEENFPEPMRSSSDGRLIYKIPERFLKLDGNFA